MSNIKVTYGNQTKRISEAVDNYETLLQMTKRLFNLDKELGTFYIRLCYLDKDSERIEISSEEDFVQVMKYHKDHRGDMGIKIEVFLSSLKDSLNVDEMLNNMKLSESFAMVDRTDYYNKNMEKPKAQNFIKVEDGNVSLQVSLLSKDANHTNSNFNNQVSKHEEKGVQNDAVDLKEQATETQKVEVNEVASNTQQEIRDQSTQMENKELKEEGSNSENILTNDVCVQAEINEIDDISNPRSSFNQTWEDVQHNITRVNLEINKDKVSKNSEFEKEIKYANHDNNDKQDLRSNANSSSQVLNGSVINDEILISKIDEILSSRMAQMEENFKKMLEIQQQSKIFLQNEGANHPHAFSNNLQLINQDNINLEPKIKPEHKVEQINHNLEININENANVDVNLNEANLNIRNNSNDVLIKDISNPNIEKIYKSLEEPRDSLYHSNEFCSACRYQILKNKYICIMCDNFILCSQCEESHSQHPLLKVNVHNQSVTNKEELSRYFVKQAKDHYKKKGIFKKGFNGIKKLFKKTHSIALYPKSASRDFAMPYNSTLKYTIIVANAGNSNIEDEIIILPKNNKIFKVNAKLIGGMELNSFKEVELVFESPKECGTYEFEIIATMRRAELLTESLKFSVTVVEKEEVDEANANLMFKDYEVLLGLMKDKKIVLYKMISQEVIKRNIEDIIRIIKKYDYDVMNAIDELTADEDDDNYRFYGQEY